MLLIVVFMFRKTHSIIYWSVCSQFLLCSRFMYIAFYVSIMWSHFDVITTILIMLITVIVGVRRLHLASRSWVVWVQHCQRRLATVATQWLASATICFRWNKTQSWNCELAVRQCVSTKDGVSCETRSNKRCNTFATHRGIDPQRKVGAGSRARLSLPLNSFPFQFPPKWRLLVWVTSIIMTMNQAVCLFVENVLSAWHTHVTTAAGAYMRNQKFGDRIESTSS